jgi:uncharacterized membrane protein
VSLIFGVVTCLAGFLGVGLGAESARRFRRSNPRADPLVCAFGLLACTPFLFFAIVMSKYNTIATWVSLDIISVFVCLIVRIRLFILGANYRGNVIDLQLARYLAYFIHIIFS